MADDADADDSSLSESMAGDTDAGEASARSREKIDTHSGEDSGNSPQEVDPESAAAGLESPDGLHGGEFGRVRSGLRLGLAVGVVTIIALGALSGWLGYEAYRQNQVEQQRDLFLRVGRQGALNLTTISFTDAGTDIKRILDSSTGQFHEEFQKRGPAFAEVVKQAQAKTEGSITEAALESVNGDSARVLVAVTVKTSNLGASDQQPRHWRMRIDVQRIGDGAKVSNVGFVP